MRSYRHIDLDVTPIVVINCGHFFTAESLDGLASMGSVYRVDSAGHYTGVLEPSAVLTVPCCPDCKRPIRQFATRRFNRVVNMAVMDETAKKFLIHGLTELVKLQEQVSVAEDTNSLSQPDSEILWGWRQNFALLASSDDDDRRAPGWRRTTSLTQSTTAPFPVRLRRENQAAAWETLLRQVAKFCGDMKTEQHPSKKLFDAIVKAKERNPLDARLAELRLDGAVEPTMVPVPDNRIVLGGRQLRLRIQMAMLRDQLRSLDWTPALEKQQQATRLAAAGILKSCQGLIDESLASHLPRLAVQCSIGYACVARAIRSSSVARATDVDDPNQSLAGYADTARDLLAQAEALCKEPLADAETLRADIEEARQLLSKSWYEPVTARELDAIKSAMVGCPQGIATHAGHWYKCQNGHVVS